MSIEHIVDRIVELASQLYYRQWEHWEVLGLGLAALILLAMAVRAHRKAAANAKHLQERTASSHLQKLR